MLVSRICSFNTEVFKHVQLMLYIIYVHISISARRCNDRTKGNSFKLKKESFRWDMMKNSLLWVWWSTGRGFQGMDVPSLEVVKDWGSFEQLDLMKSVPVRGMGVETRWSLIFHATQTILRFSSFLGIEVISITENEPHT